LTCPGKMHRSKASMEKLSGESGETAKPVTCGK